MISMSKGLSLKEGGGMSVAGKRVYVKGTDV